MHRTRALVNTVLSATNYRNNGKLILNSGLPVRLYAVAASNETPGFSVPKTEENRKDQAVDATGALLEQPASERRPIRFGTLQFLLQRRMPINSVRLLSNGVRMACDEKETDRMVEFLGPWMAQLVRPETLERLMPWTITDVLRDLLRLSQIAGQQTVRDALPAKHLQTLANRLVVQGFDKLTPLQLARAAEGFSRLRPWMNRSQFEQAELDSEAPNQASTVWPSSDWVDELVDWLHNLKPDIEPWPRTSCYVLSSILVGLARSGYKPRQQTLQAAATAMKAKLDEQLKSGYLSRRAITNAAMPWNLWRTNPDEYAPGYWDVFFKSAAQIMDEYVDTAPDPPSIEDDVGERADKADGQEQGAPRRGRRFTPQSLNAKRREFRSLLATVAMATKTFNLGKQFKDVAKNIWEKRLDEHVQYLSGINARRIANACDGLGVSLKPQTREKLMAASSNYGGQRGGQRGSTEDRDIDEFDDMRGTPGRTTPARGAAPMSGRGNVSSRSPPRDDSFGSRAPSREDAFDDYDEFQRGGDNRERRGGRVGGRGRRDDDFGFDDKPF